MSKITYNLIATGSTGNCLIINKFLALDLGVPFKKIEPYYKDIKLVFISHIHSDHLNKACVKKIARERPTVRFCVGDWLVPILLECGVSERNIDIIEVPKIYNYGICKISPVTLYHDVKVFGLRIFIGDEKAIYIIDTHTVKGVQARNYQWYFIESNYSEADLQERIRTKEEIGQYVYEYRVLKTHLSKEQADEWLLENMGEHSEYVYLHQHKDRE